MENNLNFYEEEFARVSDERNYIILSEVLKINSMDENNQFKINLAHIHDDKDGKFNLNNFNSLSQIYYKKKEIYKEYEFRSRLQAYFTILMWKQVCSKEGEIFFVNWVKTLIIQTQINKQNDSDEENNIEDINPDATKYIDKSSLRLLYDTLNVTLTHSIDFQTFFDLLHQSCIEIGLIEEGNDNMENYIHVDILNIFCKNFIRGFSKLIIDIGFDAFLLEEID